VRGLTRDNFTLTEDRVPQEISVFDIAERPAASSVAREVAPATSRFSNQPAVSGVRTVILIDRINASDESQWHARNRVDRYLGRMTPGDSVALYVLGGSSISALHDFSTDATSLRRAIDRFTARTTGEYDASAEAPDRPGTLGVWLADPAAAASEFFLRRRQFATFDALEMIAEHLSGVAGRKNLVWISEAFPIPLEGDPEFMFRLRRSARALSDAQVALYSVDARGLVGAMRLYAGKGSFPSHYGIVGNVETMRFYADETGGRAYAHTNDLAHSIGRAVDDSRQTYVLGYRSTKQTLDGNYRSIVVKVAGKGLIVRHRRGYWATAPQTDKKGREEALGAVLQRPLAATGVRLLAEPALDPATLRLHLQLQVDPASLSLAREGDRWVGTLDLLVAEVTAAGRATILEQRSLDLALTDAERDRARDSGVTIEVATRVTRDLRELRIVVRDPAAGAAGSLSIGRDALIHRR
jgi:VWFA-related protein